MIKVSISTNPEKEENLISYVKSLNNYDVDFIHCDVMDGNFVSNKCLSSDLLFNVSQNTTIALDVHLMVSNPIQVYTEYLKCRPTIITVHYESFSNKNNLMYCLTEIKKLGIMAGISIKPNTDWKEIIPFLNLCDLVLIMSVEPGKSGQSFIENSLRKIYELKGYIENNNLNIKIEVDGGVNADNIEAIKYNGADIVVIGNAFYNNKNKSEFLKVIKN